MSTLYNPITDETVEYAKGMPSALKIGGYIAGNDAKLGAAALKGAPAKVRAAGAKLESDSAAAGKTKRRFVADKMSPGALLATGAGAGAVGGFTAGRMSKSEILPNPPTRRIRALVPTGAHVSHANALHHIRGKHVGTMPRGRSNSLVRVTGTHAGGFGKAEDYGKPSAGRVATSALTGGWHGAFAGRDGHKLAATASGGGHALLGALPGAIAAQHVRTPKGLAAAIGAQYAGGVAGGARAAYVNQRKGRLKPQGVGKRDVSDLAYQPGMINPGVVTSSWSHGTPNQNFAAVAGRRGRKIG